MASEKKFGLLRNVLRALGLQQEAVDDVVTWIGDLLAGGGNGSTAARAPEFPYHLRDNFLSAAELSFYEVLRSAVGDQARLCTKVALGDVFWVKSEDQSRFRVYTNKIDRKHVDFLLCDTATMRPLIGIELDDKSHQRADRRERDEFVNEVFKAAGLPLLHVPVRRGYVVAELTTQLAPYLNGLPVQPKVTATASAPVAATTPNASPRCPKCGSEMVLRTAKTGGNAGKRFWGCSNYPNCRSMLPYNE